MEKEREFIVLENGRIQCKWKGCNKTFEGDPAGLKAFANHYHGHRKKGQEPTAEDRGMDAEAMKHLLNVQERFRREEAKAVLKTCDQIMEDQSKVYEVYVPLLGCKIRYARLTVPEFLEIEHLTEAEFPRRFLYLMWKKGDPNLTEKKLDKIAPSVLEVELILQSMLENTPFLSSPLGRGVSPERSSSKDSLT